MAKSIVITGSTRGLGLALADAFLSEGCQVTVSGRTQVAVDGAIKTLAAKHPRDRIRGSACDVSDRAQVEALLRLAGTVDVWINNAGAGGPQIPFAQQKPDELEAIVKANFLGMVLGTRVALDAMLAQGRGQIFNLEGFGSDGKLKRTGMAVYGATKSATTYFTASIADELKGTPVTIGTLFPGVVITEMLISQFDGAPKENWEKARKLYNTIGDSVETVAPFLAREALANTRNNAVIRWLTVPKAIFRFMSPSSRKRDLFAGHRAPQTK